MTPQLDENFSYLVSKHGAPRHARALTAEQEARLSGLLPESLVGFYKVCGIGSLLEGAFQMVDPAALQPLVAAVLSGDPDMTPADCHAVGYTAFGELHTWSNKFGHFTIDLATGLVTNHALNRPNGVIQASLGQMASGVIPMDAEDVEFFDFDGEPLYQRCQATLGPLAPGECYGFFPPLRITGLVGRDFIGAYNSRHNRLENIRRVPALTHFASLANESRFYLYDGACGVVRPVGTQA